MKAIGLAVDLNVEMVSKPLRWRVELRCCTNLTHQE